MMVAVALVRPRAIRRVTWAAVETRMYLVDEPVLGFDRDSVAPRRR
jgi:hypothetical protein